MKLGRQARAFDPRIPHYGMLKAMVRQAGIALLPLHTKLNHADDLPGFLGMMLNDQLGDCLIEETLTFAPGLTKAYRALYDGPVVTIITRAGKRLTSTRNHRVLTSRGFVPACLLQVGDDVLSSDLPQAIAAGMNYDFNDAPSRIEDVFKTHQRVALPGSVKRQVSRPVDFHGDADFFESEVDVVDADRLLQRSYITALRQPESDESFVPRAGSPAALYRGRASFAHDHAIRSAAPRGLSLRSELPLLFGSPGIGAKLAGLGSRPHLHASATKDSVDGFPTDAELPSELIGRFSSEVLLDKIINIECGHYSGHVCDLSTVPQWYIANGIITHNCTCAAVYHLIQDLTKEAQGAMLTEPDALVQALYTAVGGYNPNAAPENGRNPTDQGCIEQNVLAYLLNTGAPLSDGSRHKIASYVEIDVRNLDDVCEAIQEFGAVYIGFTVMLEWMQSGPTNLLDALPNYKTVDGGHAVLVTGFDRSVDPANPTFNFVSWGSKQWQFTAAAWRAFVDEAYAIVDPYWIAKTGKTPMGLDLATLEGLAASLRS